MNDTEDNTKQTLAFILPLIVFLVIVSFYPVFSDFTEEDSAETVHAAANRYLALVGLQVIVATGLLAYFHRIYLQQFPLKLSIGAIPLGILGVGIWIGICELHIERNIFESLGLDFLVSTRPAINPFDHFEDDFKRPLFMVLRFTLLAAVVPTVEELFLRGWLVRWVQDPSWETVSLKQLSWLPLLTPSLYGVLTHPSEAVAAFVWFGMVTLLMKRTGNLWDCVIVHAITNLLLGIYVVFWGAWEYW